MSRFVAIFASTVVGLLACSFSAQAQKDRPTRWFEVEVILFTHDANETEIREEFEQQAKPITFRRTRDLLTRFHYPDISNIKHPDFICDINQLDNTDITQLLLSPQLRADLGLDEEPVEQLIERKFEIPQGYFFARQDCLTSPWYRYPMADNDSLEYRYDMYPRVIISGEKDVNPYVHLMSPANFKMREIYRTLRRQRGIRPILHTAWRQPGGAAKYSRATRLYAGYDYSDKFDFQGNPIEQEDFTIESELASLDIDDNTTVDEANISVVENIERLLTMVDKGAKIDYKSSTIEIDETDEAVVDPKQVREIDGLFRIYIDAFNYLHIDAEFNIRREVEAPEEQQDNSIDHLLNQVVGSTSSELTILQNNTKTLLKNYHFKQTRRVITKQVHYFDHPYMGMIVEIRRYGW